MNINITNGNNKKLKILFFTFRQSNRGVFGINRVQNSLISYFRFGNKRDFRAQIGHSTRRGHFDEIVTRITKILFDFPISILCRNLQNE